MRRVKRGDGSRDIRTRDEFWDDLKVDAVQRAAALPPGQARRWLNRARRIAPADAMVALDLALACLGDEDPAAAAVLFGELASAHGFAEAWTGLAAAALQLGEPARAAAAMQVALSRNTTAAILFPLAAAVAAAAGYAGWCALMPNGRLQADRPADLVLDGVSLRVRWSGGGCRLPFGSRLEVTHDGQPLLGSPIDLRAIGGVEGLVGIEDGCIAGWAWHPGDPARAPTLAVSVGTSSMAIATRAVAAGSRDHRPMARPRRFRIPAAALPPGPVHVRGSDGRDLFGSPLDPAAEQRSTTGQDARLSPVWADRSGPAPKAITRRRKIDVVVPVFGSVVSTMACLRSALASLPPGARIHVIDDASPDRTLLAEIATLCGVRVTRLPSNRGFPAAANAGIALAAGRDVVLLNSDTLVAPGWLEGLADAAYSDVGIGTACPLSSEAGILSYPQRDGGNPMPDEAGTAALAALAARVNGGATIDIPVAVGFCMYIRRDCLDQVGNFREDVFAQGYGEENDFCLRAWHHGWRHVAATGVYVAHHGGASFGGARHALQVRNAAILERLHPGYDAMVQAWIEADPLAPARRALDAARFRTARARSATVLVTHEGGGGVDRFVATRAAALLYDGVRPIILRPAPGSVVVGDGTTPNLRYALPAERAALLRLLRPERVAGVELHHMLGHAPAVLGLAAALGVPHDVYVHDYAWFCARIALVPLASYCGEPPVAECEACIADHGSLLEEDISAAGLVQRSSRVLATARAVVAPSADVASRLRRHFPGLPVRVTPWEDDGATTPPPPLAPPRGVMTVCVIGGIGVEKGLDVLVACVRDAAARHLPLRFVVVGHTGDDERLLAAGDVFITGRYTEAEAVALVAAQAADLAFVPSIWPETWCYTLGIAWRAGLRAAVFDLGAPAERVRATGWGWLLPLGLPPSSVNDWLLRQHAASRRGGSVGVQNAALLALTRDTPSQSSLNPVI